MKLWHQRLTDVERLPAYAAAIAEHFARIGEPSTQVDLHGLDPRTYRTDYPGRAFARRPGAATAAIIACRAFRVPFGS